MFYETLFGKQLKYSVCQAFAIAKNDVKNYCSASEANKFLCRFPEDKSKHRCQPLINPTEGSFEEIDLPPVFNIVPSLVEKFLGR